MARFAVRMSLALPVTAVVTYCLDRLPVVICPASDSGNNNLAIQKQLKEYSR